jgi:hypothetical protein
MSTSLTKILFFILLGVVYIVFFLASNHFYVGTKSSITKGVILVSAAIIFSLAFVGYSQVTKLFPEGYCPSGLGAKTCRGGSYMYQGNSDRAKFCQELESTPEGQAEINRYDCGKGYNGMPGNHFEFTPDSNNLWNNERCNTAGGCNPENNGIF